MRADDFLDEVLGAEDFPVEGHLLRLGLNCLADREGLLEDRPRKIAAQILPYRPGVDVDGLLDRLQAAGSIRRYTVGGQRLIQLIGFVEQQNPHPNEAKSRLPPPPLQDNGTVTPAHVITGTIPRTSEPIRETPEPSPRVTPDPGSLITDPGSLTSDPGAGGAPVQAALVDVAPTEKPKKPHRKATQSEAGPVALLRQRYAEAWSKAGRSEKLALPVRRNPKPGEDPVDYSREGQCWNQLLAHARVAGAEGDEAAVALVLARLANAARMTKPVQVAGKWEQRPRVFRLEDFVLVFPEAAEDPDRAPRLAPSSSGISDWNAHREKHGEVRELSDQDIAAAIQEASR